MFNAVFTCVLAAFLAHTTAQQCGGLLHAPSTFSSPNYPNSYSSNLACIWEIIAERGIRVSLQFTNKFDIEEDPNCAKDAVIIYDWKDDSYVEIDRLCGSNLPSVYKSTSNKMKIVLNTNNETNLGGFQANWTATCGGEYHATEKEQLLFSPGYPKYWPNMFCKYNLYGPKGKKVVVEFREFDIFVARRDCQDYLNLYSWAGHQMKATYCGDDIPQTDYFEEHLELFFSSNFEHERKGFVIAYYFLPDCGGKIIQPTTIKPTPLPRYLAGASCTWTIEAPENKIVKIKFHFVSLNLGPLCGEDGDYIAVYDGLQTDSNKRLAAICGWLYKPFVVPSSGNTMTLHFTSKQEGRGFLAEVIFTHPESEGCGGNIDMTSSSSYVLNSPRIASDDLEDVIDCQWNILAPQDQVIRVNFSKFDFNECNNNQAVSVDGKCKCSFLEIRDGFLPDSLLIGSYCGHNLPAEVVSSSNRLSIRIFSGIKPQFTAALTVEDPLCKPTVINVTSTVQRFYSPGYETGSIARGIHCGFEFQSGSRICDTRLLIKKLDIRPGTTPLDCDKDKVIIGTRSHDKTIGKDYIMYNWPTVSWFGGSMFTQHNLYANANYTHQYELCGHREFVEFYLEEKHFFVNLITSPDSDSNTYKGIEIEVSLNVFCDRNYSEPYGRIQAGYIENSNGDCYTLITAPDNRTISVYFISYPPNTRDIYHDIYDGNTTTANKIVSTRGRALRVGEVIEPVFSSGKYLLIHSIRSEYGKAVYDLNYITTDKGQGCGGYLYNDQGVVTSPFYPKAYKVNNTCEFVLETPLTTRLHMKFSTFHVYGKCNENYVHLLNRAGEVMVTYCNTMWTEDYTSADNYVKIVSVTTTSNYGDGWVAIFGSVAL